jgi:hypothetical protein
MSTARDDLSWLFGACESEMGVKSNFNSLILASKCGTKRTRLDADSGEPVNGAQEDLYNEDSLIDSIDAKRAASRLGATSRNRRIMAAYIRLEPAHQRVLEAAYEKVVVVPCMDRAIAGATAGFRGNRNTLNSLLAANWSTFADYYAAGLATDPNIGVDGAPDAAGGATYFNDGIHNTEAGATLSASYVIPGIDALQQ